MGPEMGHQRFECVTTGVLKFELPAIYHNVVRFRSIDPVGLEIYVIQDCRLGR